MCGTVHKAYLLKLLIREIHAALGTWKWQGRGNVLGSRAAGSRRDDALPRPAAAASTPPVRVLSGAPQMPLSPARAALAG